MMSSARRIRVLLTVPHLTPTATPYRHMMAIARYLPHETFDLKICTLRKNGYEETRPLLDALGVPVFHARYRDKFRSLAGVRQWWQGIKTIKQHGPYDVQHSMDYSSVPLEVFDARWQGRPFIHTQRNMEHKIGLRIKARLSQRVICVSQAVAEMVRQRMGVPASKVRQIYNGVDVEAITRQLNHETRRQPGHVLCVGHIRPLKRQEDAIRALALVRQQLPHARLSIAGSVFDVAYQQFLEQLVQELKLTEAVTFLGLRNDIPSLMQQAEAVVLCSDKDALPLTILEAMTVGVPVVASAVDGNKELVRDGETGFLVAHRDVEGYAAALHTLLAQPDLSLRFSRQAQVMIQEQYSAKRMVEQIAAVYQEVAAA